MRYRRKSVLWRGGKTPALPGLKRKVSEVKMGKTQIEWVKNPDGSQGYTHNPMSGCKNHTPEGLCLDGLFPCYAWKLAHTRLKQRYLANTNTAYMSKFPDIGYSKLINPFYPRFWEERLSEGIFNLGIKPKGIFVCDMGDLFGIGVPEDWTKKILAVCRMSCYQQHRFYLLTKQPQNLIKFSPFPENCWVGVTATKTIQYTEAAYWLKEIEAKVKFISFEPLLERIAPKAWPWQLFPEGNPKGICDWLIIGACTGSLPEMVRLVDSYPCETLSIMRYGNKYTAQPPIQWLREIVEAADKAGVKVFLKDNLRGLSPKEPPFYTKCCAEVNGKDPCYEEPCLSEHLVDECSKAPNFWMLRQEMPEC